jgi:guanine nucleotide-binding protein subunit beta-2-like 1 protein
MSAEQVAQEEIVNQTEERETAHFNPRAKFVGHNAAVEALDIDSENNILVSASRDKTALVWKLNKTQECWAQELTRLVGHNHFVSGVSLSRDATHLVTSSWDSTLRLWDLSSRTTKKLFLGHDKDVLGVKFSPNNRMIISVSRDKTMKVWNILGECKADLSGESWATSIACAPMESETAPLIVAVGYWDGTVKVFKIQDKCELMHTIKAHDGRCTCVTFTPDGKWVVTGGSDRKVVMWVTETGAKTLSFSAPGPVHDVVTCPTQAWICAATYEGIAVWDIQAKQQIDLVQPNFKPLGKREAGRTPDCTCLAWAADGSVMYSGYNDGSIRAWEVKSTQ